MKKYLRMIIYLLEFVCIKTAHGKGIRVINYERK